MVNVNANTNSQYYIDNGDEPGETGGATVSYNGFTTVLTAMAVLTPCETYHIRLAIADGGDGLYDSAVFLEAGSFTSPSISLSAEASFSLQGNSQQLVEGCSEMTLTFERSAPFDDALSVGLSFSGTATVGEDISNIPNTITFAPGSATATISFTVLNDGLVEGIEDMTITLDQLNPCGSGPATSVTFTIQDMEPMSLQISPSVSFVCPEEYTISVAVTGGYPAYTYDWTGSTDTDASITVFPFTTTGYNVVVTDACGFSATASATVTLAGYQPLEVNVADVLVCGGEEVTLEGVVSGGMGGITYLWNNSVSDTMYTFTPSGSTNVVLVVTDSCGLSEQGNANVSVDDINASFSHQLTGHSTVQFTNNTEGAITYDWDFGDGFGSTRESPLHEYEEDGTYLVTLTVTNANGCEATVEDSVTVYPPLHVYVPNSFTPNADGLNDFFGVVGEGFTYYDLEIFDRWGQKLFSGRFEDAEAWDGTVNGRLVPAGAYIYRLWVEPPIGIEVKETGVIYVLGGE